MGDVRGAEGCTVLAPGVLVQGTGGAGRSRISCPVGAGVAVGKIDSGGDMYMASGSSLCTVFMSTLEAEKGEVIVAQTGPAVSRG